MPSALNMSPGASRGCTCAEVCMQQECSVGTCATLHMTGSPGSSQGPIFQTPGLSQQPPFPKCARLSRGTCSARSGRHGLHSTGDGDGASTCPPEYPPGLPYVRGELATEPRGRSSFMDGSVSHGCPLSPAALPSRRAAPQPFIWSWTSHPAPGTHTSTHNQLGDPARQHGSPGTRASSRGDVAEMKPSRGCQPTPSWSSFTRNRM